MGEAAAQLRCSRVARCRRTRVTAPKKSQTMPSRTTSAQSRHTATGWPSRSTHHRHHVAGAQIDAQPQRRLAGGGRLVTQGSGFFVVSAKASVVRRAPCSSLIRFETHPPARSDADERRSARWLPPSPVGVVMVMVVQPSPPSPSPAMHGPFLTKMLVSMAFAIWFMLSMLRECIAAVWWQPPSSCTARAMASSTFATLTTGSTGIISSVTANGMAGGRFHKQQAGLRRHLQTNRRGDFARIATDPVAADRAFAALVNIFSSSGWSCSGLRRREFHRLLAFHQAHQFVGNAIDHDQHLLVGADNVVIKRGAFDDRLRGAR